MRILSNALLAHFARTYSDDYVDALNQDKSEWVKHIGNINIYYDTKHSTIQIEPVEARKKKMPFG